MGGAVSAPAVDGANLPVNSNMTNRDLFLLIANETLIASRNIIKLQERANHFCSFKKPVLRYRREFEADDSENEYNSGESDSDFDEDNLNANQEEEEADGSCTKLSPTIRPTVMLPKDANNNDPQYVLYKKLKTAEYELSQLDTFPTSLEREQEDNFKNLLGSLHRFMKMCTRDQCKKYCHPVDDLIEGRNDEFYGQRQERIDSAACTYNDNIFDQTLVLPTFRGILAQAMERFDDWETILSKKLENDKNNRSILHFLEEKELTDTTIPPSIGCVRDAFGLLADKRNREAEVEKRRLAHKSMVEGAANLDEGGNEEIKSLMLRDCIADGDWDSVDGLLLKPMYRRDLEQSVFRTDLLKSNVEDNGRRYKSVHHVFLRNLKRKCDKHRHMYDTVKINSTMTSAKRTPLHYAAHFRRTKAIVALLLMGADALRKDADGFTPGDYALCRGHKALGASLKMVESKQRCQAAIIEKIIPVEIKEYFPPTFVREIATFLFRPLDLVGKKIVGRENDSERPGYHIWVGFRLRKLHEKNSEDPYNFTKNSNKKDSPKTQIEAKVFRACRDIDVNLLKEAVRQVSLDDSDEIAAIKNWSWNARLGQYVTGCMQPTLYRMFLSYGYEQKELNKLLTGGSDGMDNVFATGDNLFEIFVKRVVFVNGFVTSENASQILEFLKALVEECNITPVHAINKIVQEEKEFEQKFPLIFKQIREFEAEHKLEQEREIHLKQEEMNKRFSHFSALLEETLGERFSCVEKLGQLKYLPMEDEDLEDDE